MKDFFFLYTLITVIAITLLLTYMAGFYVGLVGCFLIALHNLWCVCNVRKPKIKFAIGVSLYSFLIAVLFLVSFNHIIVWLKTSKFDVLGFSIWFVIACIVTYLVFNWDEIKYSAWFKMLKKLSKKVKRI